MFFTIFEGINNKFETLSPFIFEGDKREIANRVEKYLSGATTSLGLPIGEVMLTCKLRGSDDESCQKFVPFISVSRIPNVFLFIIMNVLSLTEKKFTP